jgi:hypothetical protein
MTVSVGHTSPYRVGEVIDCEVGCLKRRQRLPRLLASRRPGQPRISDLRNTGRFPEWLEFARFVLSCNRFGLADRLAVDHCSAGEVDRDHGRVFAAWCGMRCVAVDHPGVHDMSSPPYRRSVLTDC